MRRRATRGSLLSPVPVPKGTSSTTTSHSATHPISHPQTRGCTYIFFNVLGLHSLVGIICRIEGAKYKPGEERQGKKEETSFSPCCVMGNLHQFQGLCSASGKTSSLKGSCLRKHLLLRRPTHTLPTALVWATPKGDLVFWRSRWERTAELSSQGAIQGRLPS